MSTKFKYPDKPQLVDEADWKPLSRHETKAPKTEPEVTESQPEPAKVAAAPVPKDPSIGKGFQRFIDFVKTQAKSNEAKKYDAEQVKKSKAIETYKKVKEAA